MKKDNYITLSEYLAGKEGDRIVFSPAELERLQAERPGENLLKVVEDVMKGRPDLLKAGEEDAPQKSGLARIPDLITHPIDKVSHIIWTVEDGVTEISTGGGGIVKVRLEPSDDNPSLSETLTPSDRLLHSAVATLYYETVPDKEGRRYFSLSSIWKALGHGKTMSPVQRDELIKRLWRLNGKIISIDNKGEITVKGNRYKACEIMRKNLLTFDEHRVIVNGIEVAGIEMFNVLPPPLMKFALGRRQVMQISPRMLTAAGSGANAHKVTAYILDALSRIHTGKNNKILLSSLYEEVGAESKEQRKTARTHAVKVLDCARETGLIFSYRKETGSFIITTKQPKKLAS